MSDEVTGGAGRHPSAEKGNVVLACGKRPCACAGGRRRKAGRWLWPRTSRLRRKEVQAGWRGATEGLARSGSGHRSGLSARKQGQARVRGGQMGSGSPAEMVERALWGPPLMGHLP